MHSNLRTGMVLNEEKRARLDDALARRPGAPGVVGASAPPTPISATAFNRSHCRGPPCHRPSVTCSNPP